MQIQKFHVVTFGVVVMVVLVVIIIIATTTQKTQSHSLLPDRLEASRCPTSYGSPHPVLIVSLDGFRPDYLERGLTPTLTHLSQRGVHAPYLLPVYPTKTFTNHYSIVTGLYPESHGIVDNTFYDPVFKALFTIKSPPASNGSWWGGEPIWNTLTRQGKKSATFFWPGSEADIGGSHPTKWFPYNVSVPHSERVNQVLKWLSLPPEERPSWVSLYLEEPDKQGHATGPASSNVDKKLESVDEAMTELLRGLSERELLHCVNLLIVSDHGMAQARPDAEIDLATAVPDISQIAHVIYGATGKIMLKNPSHEAEVDLATRLSDHFQGKLRAFLKTDLPKRLHYFNNRRISPIVLDLQPGYSVKDVRTNKRKRLPLQGLHGYDYIHPDMAAFFIGYGPDLLQGATVEAFQNIELYNLMCLLAGVEPAPNNGTWGALHHLLAAPQPLPTAPQLVDPILLKYPESASNSYELAAGCVADPGWTGRAREETSDDVTPEHLPWGSPSTSGGVPTPALLLHDTHVTGYSQQLKVPLWTSFTIRIDSQPIAPSEKIPWLSDPRLHPTHTATCTDYDAHNNITMTPLFPPSYGSPEVPEQAYFISNAVGMTKAGQGHGVAQRWEHLTQVLVPGWQTLHGPLNVVLGTVFDYNDDGIFDRLTPSRSLQVPSDLFAVLTRCLDKVTSLKSCDPARLDALAIVYPQTQYSWIAASGNNTIYASQYSATVRDVELLTDLTFFPNLSPETRLPLILRTHRTLWRLP